MGSSGSKSTPCPGSDTTVISCKYHGWVALSGEEFTNRYAPDQHDVMVKYAQSVGIQHCKHKGQPASLQINRDAGTLKIVSRDGISAPLLSTDVKTVICTLSSRVRNIAVIVAYCHSQGEKQVGFDVITFNKSIPKSRKRFNDSVKQMISAAERRIITEQRAQISSLNAQLELERMITPPPRYSSPPPEDENENEDEFDPDDWDDRTGTETDNLGEGNDGYLTIISSRTECPVEVDQDNAGHLYDFCRHTSDPGQTVGPVGPVGPAGPIDTGYMEIRSIGSSGSTGSIIDV